MLLSPQSIPVVFRDIDPRPSANGPVSLPHWHGAYGDPGRLAWVDPSLDQFPTQDRNRVLARGGDPDFLARRVVTAVYDPLNSICCMFSVFAWWKRGRFRMMDCTGEGPESAPRSNRGVCWW